jgi:hypothetical protein
VSTTPLAALLRQFRVLGASGGVRQTPQGRGRVAEGGERRVSGRPALSQREACPVLYAVNTVTAVLCSCTVKQAWVWRP